MSSVGECLVATHRRVVGCPEHLLVQLLVPERHAAREGAAHQHRHQHRHPRPGGDHVTPPTTTLSESAKFPLLLINVSIGNK